MLSLLRQVKWTKLTRIKPGHRDMQIDMCKTDETFKAETQ